VIASSNIPGETEMASNPARAPSEASSNNVAGAIVPQQRLMS
jgi:hypothetical protein